MARPRSVHLLLLAGVIITLAGQAMGLFLAPREAAMGEVARILHVHVPTSWVALVAYTIAFGAAVTALWTGSRRALGLLVASAEVGVVLNALMLVQGFIWARATWGHWWAPALRLVASMVACGLFAVVLGASRWVRPDERRLVVSSVGVVLAFAVVPVVVLAVRWTRTLHQDFSTPGTMDVAIRVPLAVSFVGLLMATMAVLSMRWRRA